MSESPTSMNPTDSSLTIRTHWSADDIEELRPFWISQQQHPNSNIEHFLLVCRLLPEVISPCVISVWQMGACRALLAGRLEEAGFQPQLGYLKLPGFSGRRFSMIHEGAIGHLGQREAGLIISKIRQLLEENAVDMVVFNSISEFSPLFACIAARPAGTLGIRNPRWRKHWELTLQKEAGFLVKAMRSKHRSWILKKARDLESAYSGRIAWRWHDRIDNVVPLCLQMEEVAARTYQRGLGASFKDDQRHREQLSLSARQGTLRVMVLEIDQQPAAFWLGTVSCGVFHSGVTGVVPEHRAHEVGTQMLLRLIDELVREGVRRFDFGLGDAHYKQRFGDHSWHETTVCLFGKSLRGRSLLVYFISCEALDRGLRALVQRLAAADRLKRAWRSRLAGSKKAACPD